jgi:hypothetical protein
MPWPKVPASTVSPPMDVSLMDALRPHTQQMSSPYARATAARSKKPSSRPAAGVLVVCISTTCKKIPPPEASDRPARAMRLPVRRHGLGRARSRSLSWRFLGGHHHHQGLLSQWTGSDSDFIYHFCHSAASQLPDGS